MVDTLLCHKQIHVHCHAWRKTAACVVSFDVILVCMHVGTAAFTPSQLVTQTVCLHTNGHC